MKARIKKTGEILDIASYATIAMDTCDSWGNPLEFSPEEVEFITEVTEDGHWQDVRERAAIAALQGLCANPKLIDRGTFECSYDISVWKAIEYADALVEQLKEK